MPGDTTNKTVEVENTGSVDQAVRISYTENWSTHNNGTLNGWIHPDGTKSTHTTEQELSTDERVAVLNLANTDDWSQNYSDDLIIINNYKARLIDADDLNNLGYIFYEYTGNEFIGNEDDTYDDWILKNYKYWGMNWIADHNYLALMLFEKNNLSKEWVSLKSLIRPVINLKKSAIECEYPTH